MKKTDVKKYIAMTLGCILLSVGIHFFKIPNGFATGGILGWSANTTTISNCYVDADIAADYVGTTGYSNQSFVGGLIGGGWNALKNVTATDCVFVGRYRYDGG